MVTLVSLSFPVALLTFKKNKKKISVTHGTLPQLKQQLSLGHVRKPGHGHRSLAFIHGSSDNIKKKLKEFRLLYGTLPRLKQQSARART